MRIVFVMIVLFATMPKAKSQDEGELIKRQRIVRDKGIFFSGGFSTVLGNNFGDYSKGLNFEVGYMRRMNRILSIGGSISYLKFNYDPAIVQRLDASGFPSNFYYNAPGDDGFLLELNGGDISMLSLALDLKLNFVPVKDNTKMSVYLFARPFISNTIRSDVSGLGKYYYDVSSAPTLDATKNDTWDKSIAGLEGLARNSAINGGIFLGPGIEFFPARPISFMLQASFGYTLPINLVSTRSYGNDYQVDYANKNFPLKDLGFTSVTLMAGVSLNLD